VQRPLKHELRDLPNSRLSANKLNRSGVLHCRNGVLSGLKSVNFACPCVINWNRNAWNKLQRYHSDSASSIVVKDLFRNDPKRFSKFSHLFKGMDGDILFDFSKNLIDDNVHRLLLDLAEEAKVFHLRDQLFSGEHINVTEDRYEPLARR
jgi:Phosphoglucose isomerase